MGDIDLFAKDIISFTDYRNKIKAAQSGILTDYTVLHIIHIMLNEHEASFEVALFGLFVAFVMLVFFDSFRLLRIDLIRRARSD